MSEEIAKAKKIRTIKGVVVKAIKETPDTWTLEIFVGEQDRDYRAGQFISINPHQFPELRDFIHYFEDQKAKPEPIRAYSLTSAPHEPHIAITIKPESYSAGHELYPPLLSPFLASDLLVGREIEFTGYAGAYIVPDNLRDTTTQIMHLVAGSGVVPSYSIIKDELLGKKSHYKHVLVTVNKSVEDIIFHKELKALEKEFPDRFSVYYYVTKGSVDNLEKNYFHGRPSNKDIYNLISDRDALLLFACGPALTKWQKKAAKNPADLKPRFMEWVQDVVDELGIDKHRYRREIYG